MTVYILGIETSCDETAAAVVEDGRYIRSNVVASQVELHRQYGGVFPEMASRQHVLAITPVIRQAMQEANLTWGDLTAIAVTYGPGLAGSLLVGVNAAKGLAWATGLPLIGINHIEAHIYTNWLAQGGRVPEITFPVLCLVVSGGHTELILMTDHGQYQVLGRTLDDAAGEAFDKVGRLLGLDYPGGPAIERAARSGRADAFALPRAWLKDSLDFSFSGLKTAVLRLVRKYEGGGERLADSAHQPTVVRQLPLADLAASFQAAVVDVLVEKTRWAVERYHEEHKREEREREHEGREHERHEKVKMVLLTGGVAANTLLREELRRRLDVPLLVPPPALCTDNATGVAVAGYFAWQAGRRSDWDLDVVPNLRLGE